MAKRDFKASGTSFASAEDIQKASEINAIPVGFRTPLRIDTTGTEIFGTNINLLDQINDNFRNLVLTNHGEHPVLFDFGANLRPLLFELTALPDFDQQAMSRIKTAAKKYLPFIDLETFEVEIDNRDTAAALSTMVIVITYGIPLLGSTGTKLRVLLTIGG